MVIGVDAGALSITDERLKVGVWRVTYNLLKELAKIDKTNEYRLYTFAPIKEHFGANFHTVVVKPQFGWSQISLPIEIRRHPVDTFLGLSQMVPQTNAKKIGFIYDLGFLRYPDAYPGSLHKLEYQTKQLVAREDTIVAISQVTKKDIIQKYRHDAKRIIVAYPGVDKRFGPTGIKHKEENPYFLFVGALKRQKNVPFALRVFRELLGHTKKNFDFVIVGGNYWEDPEIERTIKKLGLEPRIKLKGFVSDRDLPSYYRGATALLVTSLWEGFCLPAAEAVACGCPVVYAKTGCLPEIIGNAGVSFRPGNISDAVAALERIKTAHFHTTHKFTWERFARDVYHLL